MLLTRDIYFKEQVCRETDVQAHVPTALKP